jgi:hypothetical protein
MNVELKRRTEEQPGNRVDVELEAASEPSDSRHLGNLFERLHHPLHRRMRAVLHLDPVLRPAGAIRPIAAFGDQPLQPHHAGVAKQLGTDLTLLKAAEEYPVRLARQQLGETGLRIDSGRSRRSSPSIARTSKA